MIEALPFIAMAVEVFFVVFGILAAFYLGAKLSRGEDPVRGIVDAATRRRAAVIYPKFPKESEEKEILGL